MEKTISRCQAVFTHIASCFYIYNFFNEQPQSFGLEYFLAQPNHSTAVLTLHVLVSSVNWIFVHCSLFHKGVYTLIRLPGLGVLRAGRIFTVQVVTFSRFAAFRFDVFVHQTVLHAPTHYHCCCTGLRCLVSTLEQSTPAVTICKKTKWAIPTACITITMAILRIHISCEPLPLFVNRSIFRAGTIWQSGNYCSNSGVASSPTLASSSASFVRWRFIALNCAPEREP